jgi:hypothetical protein
MAENSHVHVERRNSLVEATQKEMARFEQQATEFRKKDLVERAANSGFLWLTSISIEWRVLLSPSRHGAFLAWSCDDLDDLTWRGPCLRNQSAGRRLSRHALHLLIAGFFVVTGAVCGAFYTIIGP